VTDRVAVITGGGSGLGFMIAATLVANGAKVYITGRRQSALDESITKLNSIRHDRAIAYLPYFIIKSVSKQTSIRKKA
jgi:NAD(P)-dependent dehydrogenase (short-subunit alcohol dehydrogenase family)